jgi:sorbitol-specific phosphotransferase system component IIC
VLNPFHEVNWRPGRPERRKFAASLVVGFPCVATALLIAQRVHSGTWIFSPALPLAAAGVTLGAILGAFPQIARPFYLVWYGVACALGFVTGNALLAAVYFLLVTPTGWVRRALGRPAFAKTFDRRATTYWRDAPKPAAASRYYRQF